MKFFIDTANLDEIKEAAALGILDGVTTNPSLLSKESMPYRKLLTEICKVVEGPVSAEVVATDTEGMIREAEDLAEIAGNITVKIPCIKEGIKAIKRLSEKDIMTNATLCFSPMQALMVAKAGGTFVSPFVGRLDDVSHVGMDLIRQVVTIYENYGFKTEVLVASIRNPLHAVDAALMGAHVATMPFKVITQLIKHPLTDVGLKRFLDDWEKVNKG
ncbi:MAG: fructose-6-phosphate aldolase [Candidatus Zixiibacteriota bacterium]|nr:MAG: fructose-6-phosphate aldolase [candidate division Zixibacteria bacterium]